MSNHTQSVHKTNHFSTEKLFSQWKNDFPKPKINKNITLKREENKSFSIQFNNNNESTLTIQRVVSTPTLTQFQEGSPEHSLLSSTQLRSANTERDQVNVGICFLKNNYRMNEEKSQLGGIHYTRRSKNFPSRWKLLFQSKAIDLPLM